MHSAVDQQLAHPGADRAGIQIVAGDSIEAVAHQFELTEQAVHKIKQRIRDRLKNLIESQVREEDDVGN